MEHTTWLYLSWNPTLAHIGISEEGPPRGSAAQVFSFGEQMHSALKGLVLTGASIPQPWERTMALEFSVRPGEQVNANNQVVVYVEVVGRYSNVLLCQGGNVVAAGHQVGSKMSSVRAVYVGKPYNMPPPPQGIPPTSCESFEEWKKVVLVASSTQSGGGGVGEKEKKGKDTPSSSSSSPTILNVLTRNFLGVSPSLVRSFCETAGIAPDTDPAVLEDAAWQGLYSQWTQWLDTIKSLSTENNSGDNNTVFKTAWSPASGAYSVLGSGVSGGDGGGNEKVAVTSYIEKIEEKSSLRFMRSYYGWFESGNEFEQAKQRVLKGVSNAVNRMAKKIASLERQSADPSVHEGTSHFADLIMANLHTIKPAATSITVEDWNTGEQVTVPLDATKTPIECAEEFYKKARKQRRAVDQVAPLLEEARQQLEYLQDTEWMVEQLEGNDVVEDVAALRETEAELVAGGFMKASSDAALAEKAAGKARKAAKKTSKRQKTGGGGSGGGGNDDGERSYRQYLSPSGFTVLIGRNSKQNDYLTTRMAQPTDVWMHARGVPGAHVLLRVPPGQEAADGDLQYTADLAAFFSKARSEGKLDVTVANPAHITKPKGAKPGQVLVKQEKVLIGMPAKSAAAAAGSGDY
jgi:predicted ribosome quality control (RQC) complex YloA/Tae2 family protein